MNSKRVLIILSGILGTGLVLAIGGALVGYLNPSPFAEPSRQYIEMQVSEIQAITPGEFARAIGSEGVIYVFKPTPKILAELPNLERSVFDPEIRSYFDKLGVFIYWGESTRFGCLLLHAPKGTFGNQPNWPGGFYDPCHDSSYDYAGRSLSNPNLSYARFTKEVSNLYVPEVIIDSGGVVRMYGNKTKYDR